MLKSINLVSGFLVVGLLVLGTGLAQAQSTPDMDAEGTLRGFEGELVGSSVVLGKDGVLTLSDPRTGEERLIRLTSNDGTPNFRIKVPGNYDIPSAMNPGDGVAVLARQVAGHWQAVEVLVKPEEPTMAPRIGVVLDTDLVEGTVTILTSSGDTQTLQVSNEASLPQDGDLVVAFAGPAGNDEDSATTGSMERVTGLTRAAEVRERLSAHLEELASDENDLGPASAAVKANHVENMIELLDRQTKRHFERLEDALDHTSVGKQEAVIGALIEAGGAREEGRRKAQLVREALAGEKAGQTSGSESNAPEDGDSSGSENRKSGDAKPADSPGEPSSPNKGRGNAAGILIELADEDEPDGRDSSSKAEDAGNRAEKSSSNNGGSSGKSADSNRGGSSGKGSGAADKVKDTVDKVTENNGNGGNGNGGSSESSSESSGTNGSPAGNGNGEGNGNNSGPSGGGSDSGSDSSGSEGSSDDSGSGGDSSSTGDTVDDVVDTVDDTADDVEDAVDDVVGGLL